MLCQVLIEIGVKKKKKSRNYNNKKRIMKKQIK